MIPNTCCRQQPSRRTAHGLLHASSVTASRLPASSILPLARLHASPLRASRLPHGFLTASSRLPHGFLTASSQSRRTRASPVVSECRQQWHGRERGWCPLFSSGRVGGGGGGVRKHPTPKATTHAPQSPSCSPCPCPEPPPPSSPSLTTHLVWDVHRPLYPPPPHVIHRLPASPRFPIPPSTSHECNPHPLTW